MDPQPLRITEPIILRLDFCKENLFLPRIPEKQIGNAASPLTIFLRQDLADGGESFVFETLDHLDEVVECERPVETDDAGFSGRFFFVHGPDELCSGAVGDLD